MKPLLTSSSDNSDHELLSALADGELGQSELDAALQACGQDPATLARWNTYHLIGHGLRAPSSPVYSADAAFLTGLRQALAHEPSLTSDRPHLAVIQAAKGEASNDASFRWKLVAGFASVAAVCAIGWNAVATLPYAGTAQLAQASPPAPASQQLVVASPQGPMVRDARIEELMAAHRQFSGASALQVPSGFLQNATLETPRSAAR